MNKIELEFDVNETKALGALIVSLSAPQNKGMHVIFDIKRIDNTFIVTINPSAF